MLNSFDIPPHKKTGQKLTNHARNTLARALNLAFIQGSAHTENIHLFYSIFMEKGSLGAMILKDMGLKNSHFPNVSGKAGRDRITSKREFPLPSGSLKKALIKSFSVAKELGSSYVGTEHLTYALIDSPCDNIKEVIAKALPKNKRDKKNNPPFFSDNALATLDQKFLFSNLKDLFSAFSEFQTSSDNFTARTQNKKDFPKHAAVSPYLDKFCLNLNSEVKTRKETIVGREYEIGRIINILGRKNKNNPLLIGQPGVGKTALVMKLAQLINENSVPPFMHEKKIMSLDVAALIAGTSFRGEFEMRLKEIIKEISKNSDIILFIDEMHNIVGAGNISGSLDLANIIKPALSRGEIRLIGATTSREYKQYIEKDAALERRFQPIFVHEPSREETEHILLGIKKDYETFHNVSISDRAANLSVELSCRYIQDRFLPDKAIDVLDETASHIRSQRKISDFTKKMHELNAEKIKIAREKEKNIFEENYAAALELKDTQKKLEEKIQFLKNKQRETEKEQRISIEDGDIIETVARISGVPYEKLAQSKGQKIKNISRVLNSKIIGQREAMEKISGVLIRSQFDIGSPERPLGSFLLLGPTGVGKTLTAKILADEFFVSTKSLVRIDMSEFMERHSVSALIGSPAGYVGYGEGGRLTEKIRRQPYSIVLFDEIEKAHGDVFNILLQILEEGTLTDAQGLEVSFKNTIVILTTNVGTEEFNELAPSPMGFKMKSKPSLIGEKVKIVKDNVIKELKERMRPELLNRLDHILVFNPLAKKDIKKITDLEIGKLADRLKKQGLNLNIDGKAVEFIAQKSLAKNQGARLVRKNISELIENKIAEMIVKDRVKNNKIAVGVGGGKLILK